MLTAEIQLKFEEGIILLVSQARLAVANKALAKKDNYKFRMMREMVQLLGMKMK